MKSAVGDHVAAGPSGSGCAEAAPFVPELVQEPEHAPAPRLEAAEEMKREVLLGMQRDAQLADCEEMDDHEFSNARKVSKAAEGMVQPGMPIIIKSQQTTDCAKMIRDRQKHIEEQKGETEVPSISPQGPPPQAKVDQRTERSGPGQRRRVLCN